MNDFTFLLAHYLWLLLLIPLWIAINIYHYKQSILDLQAFRTIPIEKKYNYIDSSLMIITITALIFALAKPSWDPKPEGGEPQGRDRVFLLDVSRSMLVNDARPNRLEVARQAIRNTINASNNDRFGLVVFAGSTSIQSPLTNDKTFFNYILDQVNSDSVAQGGTRIEDALFKVLDKMNESSKQSPMDIILISDGEDLGSKPERALSKLNEQGSRLIVIGLGDNEFGGRIPNRKGNGWQLYQGKEIWSTMQTAQLRELAKGAEQGMFIPVGTSVFDLAKIIEKLQQVWPSEQQKNGQVLKYHQGYPYCLFIALFAQIMCWLRGKQFWLVAFALLSFNSQAFSLSLEPVLSEPKLNEKSTTVESSTSTESDSINDEQVDVSIETLALMELREQFDLADSLVGNHPDLAAEVYQYIAINSRQSKVVITANYNLATSFILYGEQLNQQLIASNELLGLSPDEIKMSMDSIMDDEDFIDPEVYYSQASEILRTLLLHTPTHLASQKNLEWLMLRADEQNNENQQQSEQQKSSEAKKQQQDEESDQQEASEQNKDQTNEESENSSQSSEQSQQNQNSVLQLGDINLPPPSASAEEILQEAKTRNLTERAPKSKKQTTVERDW